MVFDYLLRPLRCRYGADKEHYRVIRDIFGFTPDNIELYKLALIHRSASLVIEGGQTLNNERLEFLGDSVISTVTSDYIYIEYPTKDEGFMTKLRSKIVSRQSLNALAVELGLDGVVIYNKAVNSSQKHLYGDAFEAMIGAIYLDKGYDFVNRLLINDIFPNHLDLEQLQSVEQDFKSRLIEWGQKNRHRVNFETRNEHTPKSNTQTFYCTVTVDDIEMGHGQGASKKEAEQQAAFSVSEYMSDEQCATLLDRVDKLTR